MTVLQVAATLLVPAGCIWLSERVKVFKALGPVTLAYAVGILAANLPGLRLSQGASLQMAEVAVPLAIPLLLFSTDLRAWVKLARALLINFALACGSAVAAASAVGWAYRGQTEEWWKIAGMLVAVYTGGSANMSAVGQALAVKSETFVLLNAADLVTGGAWLLILLSVAKRVVGKWLRPFEGDRPHALVEHPGESAGSWAREHARPAALGLGLALGIVGASVGGSLAVWGKVEAAPVLLAITTLALVASQWRAVHALKGPFELGEYVLLVFCVAMGSLADVRELAGGGAALLGLVAATMVLALGLHLLLSRLVNHDVDTALICSTAAIYGPAQVGPVAAALGNRVLVGPGLTLGLAGLALGTYLGLATAWLLKWLAG